MKYKYTDSPYREIPSELIDGYTLNNTIPIVSRYMGKDAGGALESRRWDENYIESWLETNTVDNIRRFQGKGNYGPEPVALLLDAFEGHNIKNKNVAVLGSATPWIEAILLNLNNTVTTIEYHPPHITSTRLSSQSYEDFQKTESIYDAVVTYSSIEHSGLGRYGDPLDPEGDIKAMRAMHKNLINKGTLVWGAPVGTDAVTWNAHRLYGKKRLPLLFEGFEEKEWLVCDTYVKRLVMSETGEASIQPVIVLEKI